MCKCEYVREEGKGIPGGTPYLRLVMSGACAWRANLYSTSGSPHGGAGSCWRPRAGIRPRGALSRVLVVGFAKALDGVKGDVGVTAAVSSAPTERGCSEQLKGCRGHDPGQSSRGQGSEV